MPKSQEERRAYKKQWYLDNKERTSKRDKQYYQDNKEYYKNWRDNHKETNSEYRKTPAGKKIAMISKWKGRGLICSDYDLLYSNYLVETHCDECRCRFGDKGDGSGTYKCMDHSHQTGLFRNFLCCKCNLKRG